MANPDIFGPVGTVWTVDYSGGRGELTTIELRSDDNISRSYKTTFVGRSTREKAMKGLCIGGPYDGKRLTDTDLRILGLRYEYCGYTRSDTTLGFPLAERAITRVWVHETYGDMLNV